MTPLPYYLDPKLARQNLVASRMRRLARVIRRQRLAATEQAFKQLGWDDQAARELAQTHVAKVPA